MKDLDSLISWHGDWAGLRVAVLGLGVTGMAAADTLAELGADVLALAPSASEEQRAILGVIGVTLVLENLEEPPAALLEFAPELVIVSPGFHPDNPVLLWAERAAVPTWGDVELAWRLRDKVTAAEWILITGTNGKTTTTALTVAMLRAAGISAVACGNIGTPVLDAIRFPDGFDVLVVELSSYQLHWLNRGGVADLVPLASVCLNVAPDHLDWHGTEAAYAAAKAKVYTNAIRAAVYNRDDAATLRMVEDAEVTDGCRAIGFGLGVPGPSDLGVVDGILVDRAFLQDRHRAALELTTVAELAARGLGARHVVADVLAASALARAAGASVLDIRTALADFRLDPHRIEAVASFGDILWIDDSKATNAHAAEASLVSFPSVVWIVGGLLKGVDIGALVAAQLGRLRAAILIGSDRSALREAFRRHAPLLTVVEVEPTETEGVMPQVVRHAATLAQAGDVVLLAPAAASMDQFADYAERGRAFAAAVEEYLGGEAHGDGASAADS